MGNGVARIGGSDGLVAGEAWTRFWLAGTASPRSCGRRTVTEALWAPASLLPRDQPDAQHPYSTVTLLARFRG